MMANRKLPFGYEMRRGKICINAQEAEIVRDIYEEYADGASYQQLARSLNNRQLPYSDSGKPWNKNMVARIINSDVYIGNDKYPAIITDDKRQRTICAKPSVGASNVGSTVKAIRRLSRCAACSGKLKLSENKYGWARWNCTECEVLTADATTPVIVDNLEHVFSAILREPERIQIPSSDNTQAQENICQLETEFYEALDSNQFDESAAKAKAVSLASARFDALGSEDYETTRIKYILDRTERDGGMDTELLRQITSAILIHPHGEVSLKLKNGQII